MGLEGPEWGVFCRREGGDIEESAVEGIAPCSVVVDRVQVGPVKGPLAFFVADHLVNC